MLGLRGAVGLGGRAGVRLMSVTAVTSSTSVSVPHKPSTSQTSLYPKPGTAKTDKDLQFDQVTHTGQAWDAEDYRMARFIETEKQVNPNVAMHLIAKVAPKAVEAWDAEDYRMARFIETEKQVNPNVAMHLIAKVAPKAVEAWDAEDYRMARFIETEKQVNPNVAMHLIAKVAPKAVEGRVACCDGGGGALGHPKVYINLDKPGNHACGYCGLRFFQDGQPNDGSEHIQV